ATACRVSVAMSSAWELARTPRTALRARYRARARARALQAGRAPKAIPRRGADNRLRRALRQTENLHPPAAPRSKVWPPNRPANRESDSHEPRGMDRHAHRKRVA